MNTILVATDFSAAADNAALYAAGLAQKLNAAITILHVYEMPISMNDVPIMMVSAEELKNNADRGLERVRELMEQNAPGVLIKTESRLGDIAGEMEEFCRELQPFLVVAGKHGASGVERFLFGSSTMSIIRHAHVPVIAVPEQVTQGNIQSIALAVDDAGIERQRPFIETLVQQTGAKVHIVHVKQHRSDALQTQNLLQELQPQHHTITNEDFVTGIEQFLGTHNIDLLVIMPHEHSWMERVFFKTHTVELLEKIRIPILSIPEQKH
jgi:nucleotide-binding universal stress UspA family protein